MEKLLEQIKSFRIKRGYSHEYMGHMLNMSQVAYSKVENGKTKLTVERLTRIVEILELRIELRIEENLNMENVSVEKIISFYQAEISNKEEIIFQLKSRLEKNDSA